MLEQLEEAMRTTERDDAIRIIRSELKRRTGKAWSVTGGSGSVWGWIRITVPPARRIKSLENPAWHLEHECSTPTLHAEECSDTAPYLDGPAQRNGTMPWADVCELAVVLGLTPGQCYGGVSVPASRAHRVEYVDRARGLTPTHIAQPYWD